VSPTPKQHTPARAVHGGGIKKIQEHTGRSVIDFSASLNPVPPPVFPNFSTGHLGYYPDNDYSRLKEFISEIFNRPVDEIAVGNGSIELIRLFAFATLSPGDRFRIHQPTFGEYELSARLAGGILAGPEEHAAVDFICNPNNPTGDLLDRSRLLDERKKAADEGGILFVDEAFIELSDPRKSLADLRKPSLFVLRSLTKSFAVPGIRFGYAFGEPSLIEKIETLRPPWSVNGFAEEYATAALSQLGALEESRNFITAEREWLVRELSKFPCSVHPSRANFILITMKKDVTGLCSSLLSKGILVRDCHSFGLPHAIRIAVRRRDENRQLIEALEQCLP
jgi:threonine-phosphate decarboxylase